MIQGIFYARFLSDEGTKIVAQSPPGCIVPVDGVSKPPLFEFETMQSYIIPKPAFFNRYITVLDPLGKYLIMSHPVAIKNGKYSRNAFIFNFGLVVEASGSDDSGGGGYNDRNGSSEGEGGLGEAQIPYEMVVRRLAQTFAEMEKQNEYLSLEAGREGSVGMEGSTCLANGARRPIESLLEIIKEDLNNYGECMIPVDEANTINMKLFPHHPDPPPVKGWHVPVPKTKLMSLVDPSWDLTLQRLVPHIDGVSDVRRIAYIADISLDLAKTAIQHLLRYDTIILLDLFFFGNCYAVRPTGIHDFIANRDNIVDECAAYCCITPAQTSMPGSRITSSAGGLLVKPEEEKGSIATIGGADAGITSMTSPLPLSPSMPSCINLSALPASLSSQTSVAKEQASRVGSGMKRLPNYILIKLMTTFCPGRTVMEWLKLHQDMSGLEVLHHLDVRRFIQFGVIKGLLYRVHKYVVSKQYIAGLATGQAYPIRENSLRNNRRGKDKNAGHTNTTEHSRCRNNRNDNHHTVRGRTSKRGDYDGSIATDVRPSNNTLTIPDSRDREARRRNRGKEQYSNRSVEGRLASVSSARLALQNMSSLGGGLSGEDSTRSHHHDGKSIKNTFVSSSQRPRSKLSEETRNDQEENEDREEEEQHYWGTRSRQSGNEEDRNSIGGSSVDSDDSLPVYGPEWVDPMQRYLDGCHCFDQIITEQNLTDPEIMNRLRTMRDDRPPGDLVVFYR